MRKQQQQPPETKLFLPDYFGGSQWTVVTCHQKELHLSTSDNVYLFPTLWSPVFFTAGGQRLRLFCLPLLPTIRRLEPHRAAKANEWWDTMRCVCSVWLLIQKSMAFEKMCRQKKKTLAIIIRHDSIVWEIFCSVNLLLVRQEEIYEGRVVLFRGKEYFIGNK